MLKKLKVAIVGAGNAGCAHAFKFAEFGHRVTLIKTSNSMHDSNFEAICSNGGIWAIDHSQNDKESFQPLHFNTRDVEKGLADVDIVLVMTQSLQHEAIADLITPHIKDSTKMILIVPGNLGSVFFRNKVSKNIVVGEGESTPFDARIVKPGYVNILFRNVRNKLGFLPSSMSEKGIHLSKRLNETYVDTRENIVESALHNPNLIVHTVGVIMSAARIEYTNGEFWMYKEGFTPSIWRLIDALDFEKNRVIQAYGGHASNYLDECKYRNELDQNKDSLGVFRSYANDGGPKGPVTIHSRYLYEDVQNGLCLLSSLAQKAKIDAIICNSLINIASCLVQQDFLKNGRNVSRLGWKELTLQEIIEIMT